MLDTRLFDRAANEVLFLIHSDSYERFFSFRILCKACKETQEERSTRIL